MAGVYRAFVVRDFPKGCGPKCSRSPETAKSLTSGDFPMYPPPPTPASKNLSLTPMKSLGSQKFLKRDHSESIAVGESSDSPHKFLKVKKPPMTALKQNLVVFPASSSPPAKFLGFPKQETVDFKSQVKDKGKLSSNHTKNLSSQAKKEAKETGGGQIVKLERLESSKGNAGPSNASKNAEGSPPLVPPRANETNGRTKVKRALRLFRLLYNLYSRNESSEPRIRRVDCKASEVLKSSNEYVNRSRPIIGHVPGVEVGDEFHYRVELAIVCIHHPFQSGIDSVETRGGLRIVTSIIASSAYNDDLESSGVLVYTGAGGNPKNGYKQVQDQKLERGNSALEISMDKRTPICVVYDFKELKGTKMMFIYDGSMSLIHTRKRMARTNLKFLSLCCVECEASQNLL